MPKLLEAGNATHDTRVNLPNSSNAEEINADVDLLCDTAALSKTLRRETDEEMPLHSSREKIPTQLENNVQMSGE